MKIRKAVILAAGLGTRFLPVTKSLPKEMLPIIDKPVIQFLVEEAVNSGIKEIIIVLGNGKESIKNYFEPNKELESKLKKSGKQKELVEIKKIEKLAKISYTYQTSPKGDGDAILSARSYVKNEPFAVLFGDDIWDSKIPPLKQLITEYEKHHAPIVAITKVKKEETNKYGIVGLKKTEVKSLVEKPSLDGAPSNLALTGKYIVTPELLKTLTKTKVEKQELRLIDGMKKFIQHSPIFACKVKGIRFDTGDKHGYLNAIIHFGKK